MLHLYLFKLMDFPIFLRQMSPFLMLVLLGGIKF